MPIVSVRLRICFGWPSYRQKNLAGLARQGSVVSVLLSRMNAHLAWDILDVKYSLESNRCSHVHPEAAYLHVTLDRS